MAIINKYITATQQTTITGRSSWDVPSRSKSGDGLAAKVINNGIVPTNHLVFPLSGLGLPADAAITGIEVTISRKHHSNASSLFVAGFSDDSLTAPTIYGTEQLIPSGALPPALFSIHSTTVGSSTDTWGLTAQHLTTNWWNSASSRFYLTTATGLADTLSVYDVQISVYYTEDGNHASVLFTIPAPSVSITTSTSTPLPVVAIFDLPPFSFSATIGAVTNEQEAPTILAAPFAPYVRPVIPSLNLVYQPNQYGAAFGSCDISFNSGTELETVVLASLLTWRRATKEEVPADESRYGWWADNLTASRIGSKLWLLQREKLLPTLKSRAKQYAEEALQWIIDIGIATQIDVVTEIINDRNALKIDITIYKNDGSIVKMSYDNLWDKQFA